MPKRLVYHPTAGVHPWDPSCDREGCADAPEEEDESAKEPTSLEEAAKEESPTEPVLSETQQLLAEMRKLVEAQQKRRFPRLSVERTKK